MQAENDFVDSEWTTVEVDLTDGRNALPIRPGPSADSVHAMWVERSNPGGNTVLNGESMLLSNYRTTGDSEEPPRVRANSTTSTACADSQPGVPAVTCRRRLLTARSLRSREPTAAEIARSPLYEDGLADLWLGPGVRTSLNSAVPSLRRIPDDLYVLLDRELAAIAGLDIGERSAILGWIRRSSTAKWSASSTGCPP